VFVLSLVLSLAKEVEKSGHEMEGQLLRIIAIVSVLLGAITAIVVLGVFSIFPSIFEIASVLTMLVVLVVSLEILLAATWFIAGVRLGMLKSGFKFVSREAAAMEAR
jgi:membrane protein YdbS with pleckstrin-like domain